MTLEIDQTVDAAYVVVNDQPVDHTVRLDQNRLVDYDSNGGIVGIEFLSVSRGVDLSGLPDAEDLEHLFRARDIRAAT